MESFAMHDPSLGIPIRHSLLPQTGVNIHVQCEAYNDKCWRRSQIGPKSAPNRLNKCCIDYIGRGAWTKLLNFWLVGKPIKNVWFFVFLINQTVLIIFVFLNIDQNVWMFWLIKRFWLLLYFWLLNKPFCSFDWQ